MGDIVNAKQIDVSAVDLNWMIGCSVTNYSFNEPDLWVIRLSDGGLVFTQSIWRVTTSSGIAVSSQDHGQLFGLKVPVDAAARAMLATFPSLIAGARIDEGAPDLVIRFANGSVLQVLATSLGYESWQTSAPSGVWTALNGSRSALTWTENRTG